MQMYMVLRSGSCRGCPSFAFAIDISPFLERPLSRVFGYSLIIHEAQIFKIFIETQEFWKRVVDEELDQEPGDWKSGVI
jgi:hypothetical protein